MFADDLDDWDRCGCVGCQLHIKLSAAEYVRVQKKKRREEEESKRLGIEQTNRWLQFWQDRKNAKNGA